MSKNIIQSIVLILAILIVLAFLGVIYGMYLKISTSDINSSNSSLYFSTLLIDKEKIKNIEVIDNKNILILIEGNNKMRGLIYNISDNKVIREIVR